MNKISRRFTFVQWLRVFAIVIMIVCGVVSVLASPIDELNLTESQKENICDVMNFSMFKCVSLWVVLDNYEFSGECNYSGLVNSSNYVDYVPKSDYAGYIPLASCNSTVIVNNTCKADSRLALMDEYIARGFSVEPVFLDGELSNFRLKDNSVCEGYINNSVCETQKEEQFNAGKSTCETPEMSSGKGKANFSFMFIFIGGVVLLFLWWTGLLKKIMKKSSAPQQLQSSQGAGLPFSLPSAEIPFEKENKGNFQ